MRNNAKQNNDKVLTPSITLTHNGSHKAGQNKYYDFLEKPSELNGVIEHHLVQKVFREGRKISAVLFIPFYSHQDCTTFLRFLSAS